ncbi:MAG: hypothetical protein A3K18_15145 [Lentisphaerae bacterium RIFOXYA12_64_32]|nr:MAG: hypothetical protein A3K18_15145 [Lentisphaerae bacterium RIFOXYA12_64_32]
MTHDADDDPHLTEALWRYRLIADAVELPAGQRTALLRQVADEEHARSDGELVRVSLRTLQRWVRRHKSGKLRALKRGVRKDTTATSMPTAAVDACCMCLAPSATCGCTSSTRSTSSRDGIALLTAEAGCGKSTLLGAFARSLDPTAYLVVYASLSTLGPFSLLASLSAKLGLRARRFKGETALDLINHLRSLAKRSVVILATTPSKQQRSAAKPGSHAQQCGAQGHVRRRAHQDQNA